MRRLASLAALVVSVACTRAPDPLASFRETCQGLSDRKELKAGLSVEQCAKDLKAAEDANDPARRADELAERLQALVLSGKGKQDATHVVELRDALGSLQALGRPAVAPLLSRMKAAQDADVRIAYARVLVSLCVDDCGAQKYECIVPALLEGTTTDKPAEVRLQAIKGLSRCTGQELGDDAAAWQKWWADQPKATAAR